MEKVYQNPEMDRFRAALKQAMRVSKDDLKEILAQENAANADKPKRGPKPTGTLVTEQIPEQTSGTSASKV